MPTNSTRNKILIAVAAVVVNAALTLPASNLLKSVFGLNVFAQLYQPYVAFPASYILFVLGWRVFTDASGLKLYVIPALTLLILSPLVWFIYIVAELAIR